MTNQNYKITTCPFCNSPSKLFLSVRDVEDHECTRCGRFLISGTISAHLGGISLTEIQIANISGWIKQNNNPNIEATDLDYLKELKVPSLIQKVDKFLRFLISKCPTYGDKYKYDYGFLSDTLKELKYFEGSNDNRKAEIYENANKCLSLLSITWSKNLDELSFIVSGYLKEEKRYINYYSDNKIMITVKGWEYIDSIKTLQAKSKNGFVAMWFDTKMHKLFNQAIEPAIKEAGYDPVRIDKKEHNNKIDDEIISEILKSKFVVAELTGQRGGVYFEAGYAMGLNIPVIWLCNKEEMDNVHFDNRQYNFILWHEDELGDLKERLKNRITSTIK